LTQVLPIDGELAKATLSSDELGALKPSDHFVRFFATYDIGHVNANRMCPFLDNLEDLRKKCRSGKFREAIQEAQEYLNSGTEPVGFSMPVPKASHATDEHGDLDNAVDETAANAEQSDPASTTPKLAKQPSEFRSKRAKMTEADEDLAAVQGLDTALAAKRLLQRRAMRRIGLLPRHF
jgi:hypothetical protein